jgi:hypothetical protein
MSDSSAPTRRQALVAGGCAIAVAAVTWGALSTNPSATEARLGEVAVGERFGDATVVAIHSPHMGAIPVVMALPSGTRFQVDVLARDPDGPAGIAETSTLSLYLANRGDGATRTDEGQGLAVIALARRLDAVEAPAGLLTLAQRTREHPDGSFGVPLS